MSGREACVKYQEDNEWRLVKNKGLAISSPLIGLSVSRITKKINRRLKAMKIRKKNPETYEKKINIYTTYHPTRAQR
jgi:hypothetical protein